MKYLWSNDNSFDIWFDRILITRKAANVWFYCWVCVGHYSQSRSAQKPGKCLATSVIYISWLSLWNDWNCDYSALIFYSAWLMGYYTVYGMMVLGFAGTRTLAAASLFLTVMLTWRESPCLLRSRELNPMISCFRVPPSAPLALHCTAPLLLLHDCVSIPPFSLFPHVRQPQSAIRPHTDRLTLVHTYSHSLCRSHIHARTHTVKKKLNSKCRICFRKQIHNTNTNDDLTQMEW